MIQISVNYHFGNSGDIADSGDDFGFSTAPNYAFSDDLLRLAHTSVPISYFAVLTA